MRWVWLLGTRILWALGTFAVVTLLVLWMAVRPPRLTVPGTPADHGLPAEAFRVTADDGVGLAGWLVPRSGAPVVVLLHGYPAEKADLLPLAAVLAPQFAVLLMDHRYFGESQGRVTTLGSRERRDLVRVADALSARGAGPIGVFGLSMGGAVALLAAAEEPRIRAVAAYAPFADLAQLGRELYGWLGPLSGPFVAGVRGWGRVLLGVDLARPSPEAAARRLTIPVLLVHNAGDEQIPFAHAERLRAALRDNPRARFVLPPRGLHNELPADFFAQVAAFFREHLPPGT